MRLLQARHIIGHCLVVIVAECSTDCAVYVNVENRVVIFIRAELKYAVTQPCNILFEQFAVFAELGLNVVDKRMGQNLCALDNHFIRIGVAIVTGLGENINGLVGMVQPYSSATTSHIILPVDLATASRIA